MLRALLQGKALYRAGIFLLFLLVGTLLFSRAMDKPLNHDEHQFVTAGKLLAEHGLLPYRDFPYHHQPLLVFVYAFINSWAEHTLFADRVFSVAAGWLSLILIYVLVNRYFQGQPGGMPALAGLVSTLLLVANPLMGYTSGLAWNHDLAIFLTIGAVAVYPLRTGPGDGLGLVILSGLLVGLAIGTRLSFALLPLAFLAPIFLSPDLAETWGKRIRYAAWLGLGVALGLAPSLILLLIAPRGYLFGNYIYPQLNTVYRQLQQHRPGMTLGGKLLYFGGEILWHPNTAILFFGFLFLAITILLRWKSGARSGAGGAGSGFDEIRGKASEMEREAIFLVAVSTSLLLGAFAPTPLFSQYFYAPLPFFTLCLFYAIAKHTGPARSKRMLLPGCLSLGLLVVINLWGDIGHLQALGKPQSWPPVQIHRLGEVVADELGAGAVLTLAPIIPLEGGLDIYPAFATGPFTWRTAPILGQDRQRYYGVIAPEALDLLLANNPPSGVLIGFERNTDGFVIGDLGGLERPLRAYARVNGYTAIPLATDLVPEDVTLWVR